MGKKEDTNKLKYIQSLIKKQQKYLIIVTCKSNTQYYEENMYEDFL